MDSYPPHNFHNIDNHHIIIVYGDSPKGGGVYLKVSLTLPIKYAHNDLISDLDLLRISEAILNPEAFAFGTNILITLNFDISSGFC